MYIYLVRLRIVYNDEQRTLDTNFDATRMALAACHDSTDLVLWPETAITFYITSPGSSYELGELYNFLARIDHPLSRGSQIAKHIFQAKTRFRRTRTTQAQMASIIKAGMRRC